MSKINFVTREDHYEIKLGSMLASYDRDILTNLYQPIIGYAALSLYFTLWGNVIRNEYSPLNSHDHLLNQMGIELSSFFEARCALEGIGLLKTYQKKEKKVKFFIYELYAPKSPSDFFNDVIYKGLLSKKIGESEVEKLALIFSHKELNNEEYEDISIHFSDIYTLDNNEAIRVMNVKNGRKRKTLDIAVHFEIGDFINELTSASNISEDALSADDINEIKRLATLFGLDIVSMVDVVNRSYDICNENHLDYQKMFNYASMMKDGLKIVSDENDYKEYNESDAFGKKLNQMSQYSPFEYLRLKQNLTNPSPSDIKIINILSSKYNLTSPVINALIDYTLIVCNNQLPQAYIEKVASTLARKGVTTALAACNELKPKKRKKKEINVDIKVDNNDEIDVDELLKEAEGL